MTTKDLIPLLITHNNVAKEEIEDLLKMGFQYILELKAKSLQGFLSMENVNEVEKFFIENQFEIKNVPKPLYKYIKCIHLFFQAYLIVDNRKTISNSKINIFEKLRKDDILIKGGISDYEISIMLRILESYWIASNQVYTKYQIDLVRKKYIK